MLTVFQPSSLLVALWPTQEFEFPDDVSDLGRRLREAFPQFNEERQVIAPGGAILPPEVARLVLLGGSDWVLELAPGRVALRLARAPQAGVGSPHEDDDGLALAQLFEQHRAVLLLLLGWLAENLNCHVYRIGVVLQLFCETRASANSKIAQYFFHPRAMQGQSPIEIDLGLLARLALENGTLVNRWLRVRPLRTLDNRHLDFAAQIEIDINTLTEDTRVRNGPELAQHLAAVAQHLAHGLPLLHDADFLA